jgi:hypothetical protein
MRRKSLLWRCAMILTHHRIRRFEDVKLDTTTSSVYLRHWPSDEGVTCTYYRSKGGSLTENPTTLPTKRHLSFRRAAGFCSTSVSSNLLARSPSLGFEPGCCFGASGLLLLGRPSVVRARNRGSPRSGERS